MATTKKIFKRIGIGIGALFLLLVIAAIAIPFFVNVDNYRPQIVEAVNKQINGKFDLGPLKLTLWGQIKVEVGGFQLQDAQGRKVVAAKDVYFHVPWLSIFSGSPLLTFKMMKPEVIVIKDKNGKINAMTIMKSSKETPAAAATDAKGSPTDALNNLPGIARRTRLGMEMRNALLDYQDATTGLSTKVNDLNVVVKDLSLSRPTDIEVWAELDTKMAGLTVKGPARMSAQGKPQFNGSEFKEALFTAKADLNDLEIMMPGLFEKRKGIVAGGNTTLKVSPTAASIESMELKFHNAVLNASGGATNLGAETSPVIEFKMKSNEVSLKPWNELVPPLKSYDLAGTASMEANANGALDKLQYGAFAAVKGLTAKAPNLKAEPRIDASIKIVTDQVENMSMTFKAPGNDLKATGKVVSFTAPNANISITSTGLDLDQLVEFPKPEKKAEGKPAETAAKKPGEKPADFDAALDPLRENKMAAAAKANIVFNLAMIKAYGVKMTDMQGQMSFRDLGFYVDRFKMGLWNGTITSTAGIQMKPKTPTYRFNADVSGLDIKQAVASQLELFKNTLVGIANFKMDANGASFNPEPAKGNLNAKGNMKVTNATFATIDIAKMAGDAINRAVDGISAKVPALKGKKVGGIGNTESKYEFVSADFTIQGGYFSAPNFFAKSEPNKGIDVRGDTKVGIKDYSLRAKWELVDTYNLLKARDLNVETNGVRIDHILAEGNNPVILPIEVGGTIFAPTPNYTSVPEALGKIALNNVASAAGEKAKSEAKKAAAAEANKIIQKAPPAAQEALKGLGKKLFGN